MQEKKIREILTINSFNDTYTICSVVMLAEMRAGSYKESSNGVMLAELRAG